METFLRSNGRKKIDNVLPCHSSIERILTNLMKKKIRVC